MLRFVYTACVLVGCVIPIAAADPDFTRKEDVVYGRKHGMALTMDVFSPKEKPNGLGVILCVSGGFFSSKEAINLAFIKPLLSRGYTVFAVVHGSQPRFTIPEILVDMQRATRYIRHHAKDYGVDPDRLGIYGGSAGGHLSLSMGMQSLPGNPTARDPVERVASGVQAVACFFPPTDFLNYGKPGEIALGTGILSGFKAPFDFCEIDGKTRSYVLITDEAKRKEIGKQISPVYMITEKSAPTLIIHGDADKLVPIQQAELVINALKEKKVPCELVVRKGAAHGWQGIDKDIEIFANWFDKHLKK